MPRHRWLLGVLAAATTATVLIGPADAAVSAPTLVWTSQAASTLEAEQPELLTALRRDLRLGRDEAIVRVGRSATAHRIHDQLRATLGRAYAGAWLDPDGAMLTVAVTDRRLTGVVRAAGANPRVVAHSVADLRAALDHMSADGLPAGVQGSYVDQPTNSVVVESSRAGREAATAMVTRAGVDPGLVRHVTVDRTVSPTINLNAGDLESRVGCTFGFGVRRRGDTSGATGSLTAGHCGPVGQTKFFTVLPVGQVAGSTFNDTGRGPDQGWIAVSGLFRATPNIDTFTNGLRTVSGSVVLMANDFVCQAGGVSGFRCGTVEATNLQMPLEFNVGGSVVRREVTGLTRTNVCAANGDSGGPVVGDGFRAAGIVVAAPTNFGIGSCSQFPNGPMLYQPIDSALNAYGLELLPPPPAPQPTALHIESGECDREATGPGWVCYVRWGGGVDLATATWSVYHPRPAPYVISDSRTRMTEAHFACFFDESESDYLAQLTIRDAVGAQVTFSSYVCSW